MDPLDFEEPLLLMLGYVSALTGCCIWLIVATVLNLPVSGTHSIVGATIGMAIVSKNIGVVNWWKVLEIGKGFFFENNFCNLKYSLINEFKIKKQSCLLVYFAYAVGHCFVASFFDNKKIYTESGKKYEFCFYSRILYTKLL